MPYTQKNSNWHKYFNLLNSNEIPDELHRYYMALVKKFLDHFPGRRVSSILEPEIQGYFIHLNQNALTHRFNQQSINAVQLLLVKCSAFW